ncbi:XrtA/PEP-CTERM system TPR-repeat protein PrsT [Rheinheimera maricola]|uniref:PEP-CTERM system TPR-repeat protein PrsT n=1 Tax=Rheinheimera maricola TaxID=2793282 RepID=A0ABS7XAM7_9GAMM|nr:XrtA/PEP-CTERM system TPR-repeat protein PrsT [Rheinheimera maricola]MBZ9612239.1 PEP-CTERM system TPR-repeat protein PrsT [Rheinheimera maricola]
MLKPIYNGFFAAIWFACVYVAPAAIASVSAEHDYEQALQAFQRQEQQAAYIHLKNVLQQTPDHIPAKVLMGKVLLEKGYFEEATTEFEEALYKGADIELMLTELANSYLFAGKYQQVLKLGEQYKLSNNSLFEWHLLAAAASLNLDNIDNARAHFISASALQPDSIRLLNSQVALLLKEKRLKDAELLLDRALSIQSDNPQSLQLQGELLQLQGQLLKAQDYFEKAVLLSPQDPVLRRALLRNYVSQYKTEQAEQTLQQILLQSPGDPYALLLAAWLSSLKENHQQSEQHTELLSAKLWQLSKAQIESQPSLLFSRALLSYVAQNYEKARGDLVSYNQLVPADLNAVSILIDVYIRQGDNSLAIQLAERHLEQLNTAPELAKRLVTLYINSNRAYKAEQLITSLRLQFPANVDFAILHAAVLKQMDQADKARAVIAQEVLQHSDNMLLRINQALLALDNNNYTQALQLADQLLAAEPNNTGYLNFKAATLIKSGKAEQAYAVVQNVLKQQPDHIAAQFNLARLEIDRQNYAQAISLLKPLASRHKQHKATATLLALAYFRAEQYNDAEVVLQNTLASGSYAPATELLFDLYFTTQRYEPALALVEQGLKSAFMDEILLWKKARLLLLLNQPEKVNNVLPLLSDLVDTDPEKLLKLALMQREINDLPASGLSLQEAITLAPSTLLLQLELANHYLITADINAADVLLKKMAVSYPKNANVTMLRGDLALAEQNESSALALYQQALKQDPQFRLAWVKLYQIAKAGKDGHAFDTLALQALKQTADNHWLRRLLAEHYVNAAKPTEAIEQYQLLLDANQYTNDAAVYNNLANLHLASDIDVALEHAEKALQLAPKQAFTLDTYGWVLAKKGQYQQAVATLRQANALNATNPSIQFHIAYTLVKLQRPAEANTMLGQLLANFAEFPERVAAEQLLAELSKAAI